MKTVWKLLSAILLLLVVLSAPGAHAAPMATLTVDVDTTLDSNDAAYQACTATDGDCSLRGAISKANADAANAYVINLPIGVYTLTLSGDDDANATGDLDVANTITIQGAGAPVTVIQAGTTSSNGIDRLFHVVDSSADLTLKDLTIRYGRASGNGGSLYNQGRLSLENTTIISNTAIGQNAIGGNGGGIYNLNFLTLMDSTVEDNVSTNEGSGVIWEGNLSGGGIYNESGTLATTTTLIISNSAAYLGGGVYSAGGTLSLSATQIISNSADGSAGLDIQAGPATIQSSIISGNLSTDFSSGGINNQGVLNLIDSTISYNQSQGDGGGLYNQGTLTITGSTISDNSTNSGDGAGIYNTAGSLAMSESSVDHNSASSSGGGIYSIGGEVSIASSSIVDNTAGGGGGGITSQSGTLHIFASTISGNQALGTSSGGGIGNANGTVNITNSTISGNTAGDQGGGIFTVAALGTAAVDVSNSTLVTNTANAGGGLNNQVMFAGNATLTITNSIITSSTGGDCVNTGGTIAGTNNLIDDYASGACSGVSNAAVTGLDPLLLDNGPVRTHRLLPDSNAIDAANPTYCPTTDQRGFARDDLQCDIGAYELKYADSPTVIRPVSSTISTTFGSALMGIQRDPDQTDPGVITVTKSLTWKTRPANAIDAYWYITPTVASNFNLTLTLCYTLTESNGRDINALRFWRFSANQWTAVGGTPVTSTVGINQCATMAGVTELSAWTLATDSPTAITLNALSARTSVDAARPLASGGLLLLTGIVVGGAWLNRRRIRRG